MCYKQKCKVVSLNLAHPVYPRLNSSVVPSRNVPHFGNNQWVQSSDIRPMEIRRAVEGSRMIYYFRSYQSVSSCSSWGWPAG